MSSAFNVHKFLRKSVLYELLLLLPQHITITITITSTYYYYYYYYLTVYYYYCYYYLETCNLYYYCYLLLYFMTEMYNIHMYTYSHRIKGLSRTGIIESIPVDVDTIDIGEPLSDQTTSTTSPSIAVTTTMNKENVTDINSVGTTGIDDRVHNGANSEWIFDKWTDNVFVHV